MSVNKVPDIELTYTLDDIVQAALEDPSWDLPEEDRGILYMTDSMFITI